MAKNLIAWEITGTSGKLLLFATNMTCLSDFLMNMVLFITALFLYLVREVFFDDLVVVFVCCLFLFCFFFFVCPRGQ